MKIYFSHIIFETTTDCSLDCLYCYNIWKRGTTPSVKLNSHIHAKRTLEHFFHITQLKRIILTGGEPFLAENFYEIVQYCLKANKIVSIISNGNSANYNDYKFLISKGVVLFEFPFLSSKSEIHDYLTQSNNSWEKCLNSINDVLSLGGNVIPVIVLTRQNFRELQNTITFLADLGIKNIMLNRFNIGGAGIKNVNKLVLSKEDLNECFKVASKIAIKREIKLSANVCTPMCILNPSEFSGIQFSFCSQNVMNRPLTLDILGNMRICNHSPKVIGNIFQNSLKEMLTSKYIGSWMNIKPDYCVSCNKFESCLAGCRAASEQMGFGLEKEDPIISIIE